MIDKPLRYAIVVREAWAAIIDSLFPHNGDMSRSAPNVVNSVSLADVSEPERAARLDVLRAECQELNLIS